MMKKNNILGVILATVITFCACDDDNNDPAGARGTAPVPEITEIATSFYNIYDLQNSTVEFTVDAESEVKLISVEVSYNGQQERKTIKSTDQLPATFVISAEEVSSILELNMNSIEVGDIFNFEIVTESTTSLKTRSNTMINASVACESKLTGTYTCVASGKSTDSGPSSDVNPATDFTTTVLLTEGAVNGEYTISDFSGGLFTSWYGIYGLSGEYEGKIKDSCGELSYFDTKGPFGSPISGTGSIDSDGVITIEGMADSWGDTWTLVLTPN